MKSNSDVEKKQDSEEINSLVDTNQESEEINNLVDTNQESEEINNLIDKKQESEELDNSINKNQESEELDGVKDNRVLLISENKQTVFLPYYADDLKTALKDSDYENISQIIEQEYTVPISRYNSSFISRFNETYNLMRNKEKASVKDSLELAVELTFNNLLNPAIITACRNLDELDIYLDYLRTNEVDKFKIFEIKYEYSPVKK